MKYEVFTNTAKKMIRIVSKRNLYLLLLAAFFTAQCVAQSTWQKTFDLELVANSQSKKNSSIAITPEGDILMVGSVSSPPTAGGYDMCVNKIDNDGNLIWSKIYGTTSNEYGDLIAVSKADSSIFISGRSGNKSNYFVKLDKNGNFLWDKQTSIFNSYSQPFFGSIDPDGGGGALFVCRYQWSTVWRGLFVRINSSGTVLDNERLNNNTAFPVADGDYSAYGLKETVGSGYVAVQTGKLSSTADYFFEIRNFNSVLGHDWTRFIDGPNDDFATSISELPSGEFVIGGYTDSYGQGSYDPFIMKLNSNGSFAWFKCYGKSNDDRLQNTILTNDGGFVGTGWVQNASKDILVIKTDASGSVEWQKEIGNPGTDELGYQIAETTDGGYIIAADSAGYALIVKIDSLGNTGSCGNSTNYTGFEFNYSPPVSTGVAITQTEQSAVDITTVQNNRLMNSNIICFDTGCSMSGSTSVTSNYNGADVSCNGDNDGQATAIPTGGSSPYTYSWSSGGSNAVETGLGAGTYTVTITDNNNCTTTATVTLNNPPALNASSSVSSNYNGADISCNGDSDGEATATGSGGTGSYTYAWSNSQNTQTTTGLSAGTYTVTITDANGCTETSSVTLNNPPALNASSSVSSNYNGADVSCNGDSDGEATATGSGGTGSYTYAWSNSQNTQTTTGLSAGTYTVTITDANGCTETSSVTLNNPPALTGTSTTNNATCGNSDGDATATGAGGTGSYSYQWDANANNQNTQTATGLASGNYDVTITDDNGCTAVVSATVNNTNGPSPSIASQTDIDCFGNCDGEATATQTGGQSPYTYAWSSGGNTDTETGLCAGTYTITITDANNCDGTTTVTITEPPVLTGAITTGDDFGNCDGTASAAPAGGTSPYTYQWDDSNTQTTQQATGLCAGTYCVTITDANGCTWDTCGVDVAVGINNPNMQGISVQVYPNPNSGVFTVELNGIHKNTQVRVTDALGREVALHSFTKTGVIDLSKEGKGVYFLQVETENGTLVQKVIIE